MDDASSVPQYVRARPAGRLTVKMLMGLVALLAPFLWVARESMKAREAARASQCVGHLKQFGLALFNYESAYGCYPPAIERAPDGRPTQSWRAAILWVFQDLLSGGVYDFSVPWDHPSNAPLASYDTTSSFFWCPSGEGRRTKDTDYVAVVGPHTAWPEGRGLKLSEITDDPASTVLLIEVADSGIHWMKPEDITLDDLLTRGPSGNHPAHFTVLFADGSVRRLRKDIDRATLKALLTIDGGEAIDLDSL
jgi:hypothetical protein